MGAPVPSASHKARTIISYFILYISTLRRRETLTRRTPEEGRENKREIALWHVRLERVPSFSFKLTNFVDNRESAFIFMYIFSKRYYETKEGEERDNGRERVIRKRISLLSRDNFFFSSSDSSFFSRVPGPTDSSTLLCTRKKGEFKGVRATKGTQMRFSANNK